VPLARAAGNRGLSLIVVFQPLFRRALELCENGNEEIAYEMLWSGKAYDPAELEAARHTKDAYAVKA